MRASTQLMKNETRERTSRKLQWISGAAFVLALVIFSPAYAQPSAEVLLQSGLYKEDVNGDLEAAIGIYERVLKEFPQDRSAAAKALLHTGLCYEKLGKQEAQKAYRRLIEEYADQLEVVKDARQRLASLVAVSKNLGLATGAVDSAGMTIKRIDIEEIERLPLARLSPDGTKMLYIHMQEEKPRYSLRAMNLSSRKSQTLVEGIDWGDMLIFEWSPDGKKVVYRHGGRGLCVIDSEGGKPEVLWSYLDPNTTIGPLDWSLDGLHILAAITNKADATLRLVSLPAKGGEPHTIVSGKAKELDGPAGFSPDGKYSVGQKREGLLQGNAEIYVWPVEGGKEIPITNHPARDHLPFWSPDGTRIAYTSRKGNLGLPRLFVSSGNQMEDLEIPVGGYYVANVEWARDGRHLLFPGMLQPDGHLGIFRVSLESQKIEPLHVGERPGTGFKGAFTNLRWLSKAGKFMFEKMVGEKERELYTTDVAAAPPSHPGIGEVTWHAKGAGLILRRI